MWVVLPLCLDICVHKFTGGKMYATHAVDLFCQDLFPFYLQATSHYIYFSKTYILFCK